ncbi:hypothetical protein Tco_1320313 [Tanacetum coccineum]
MTLLQDIFVGNWDSLGGICWVPVMYEDCIAFWGSAADGSWANNFIQAPLKSHFSSLTLDVCFSLHEEDEEGTSISEAKTSSNGDIPRCDLLRHATAMLVDFGLAKDRGGGCYLSLEGKEEDATTVAPKEAINCLSYNANAPKLHS